MSEEPTSSRPGRSLRGLLVVLALVGAGAGLIMGLMALAGAQQPGQTAVVVAFMLVVVGIYAMAGWGLLRGHAWSWMVLVGVSVAQAWTLLFEVPSLLRYGATSMVLLPVLVLTFHAAVVALAVHPKVRAALPAPPGARG